MNFILSKYQQPRPKSVPISVMACLRCATAVFAMLILGACTNTPAGFDAVPASNSLLRKNECPELAGTFNLAFSPRVRDIDPHEPLNTHGLPVVITFKQGQTQTEAWWVVPRQRLLSFASALRTDSPERYARWRDLMLKDNQSQQPRPAVDAYLADVAEVGPPGPVNTGFEPRRCRDNWMLVSTAIEFAHAAADGTYNLRHETWLAHDETGALLVKHLAFKASAIPIPDALRWGSITEYTRFEPMPFEAVTPLVAADLPVASR